MRFRLLVLGLLAACTATGPHVPGTPDHHRQGGFANETGVSGTDPVEFLVDRTRMALGIAGHGAARSLSEADAAAMWSGLGRRDAVQWLGHASIRLRLSGHTFAIDPVIGARASPISTVGPKRLSNRPVPVKALSDVDAILITHDHYDHFEKTTVDALHAASGASCIMPLALSAGEALNCSIRELDWRESIRAGATTLTLLPAQHESGRSLVDRNETLWGSWLISSAKRNIYVSGDTGYGPHFSELGQEQDIDLAIMNLGGYAPRRFNKHVHLNPEEVIRAVDDLGAKRVLIVHWGTYPLGREDARDAFDRVHAAAKAADWKEGRLVIVPIGTAFALGSDQ